MLVPITPSRAPAAAAEAIEPPRPGVTPLHRKRRGAPAAARVTVRAARVADMRAVEPLIRGFARGNLMLAKSFDELARAFREFVVAVDDRGRVIGCGALRIYTEDLGEICSLAVAEPFQGHGIGRLVVERLVEEARSLELETVFALTLRPDFFGRLGFQAVPTESFPLKVWADCRSCPKLHACDEIAVAIRP
jgi:amino-acid N-acetyltransferase